MTEYRSIDRALVDIGTVKTDKNLPQSERYKEFKRQIVDTSLYECEGFTIHANYKTDGTRIEDCLRGMKA